MREIAEFIRHTWGLIREQLWIRPLVVCAASLAYLFLLGLLDGTRVADSIPLVAPAAVEVLLTVMSGSMLVVATFAVGAMVSAYASAGKVATPRTFPLVIADDLSQNALSVFVAAFIFSSASLVALKAEYFGEASRFAVLLSASALFLAVVVIFTMWVNRIARLGRMGDSIDLVEQATRDAIVKCREASLLGSQPDHQRQQGIEIFSDSIGYLQRVNIAGLQAWAEQHQLRVIVHSLPGTFLTPDRPLATVVGDDEAAPKFDVEDIRRRFTVGKQRLFPDDPRFGLIVMSQIAAKSLSPAVNDPGTAIDVIASLVRILDLIKIEPQSDPSPENPRVQFPTLRTHDLFDDAFGAIARDGAAIIEVVLRLLRSLESLAAVGDEPARDAAIEQARRAVSYASDALRVQEDLDAVRAAAKWIDDLTDR